jgi:hypothetical protein
MNLIPVSTKPLPAPTPPMMNATPSFESEFYAANTKPDMTQRDETSTKAGIIVPYVFWPAYTLHEPSRSEP